MLYLQARPHNLDSDHKLWSLASLLKTRYHKNLAICFTYNWFLSTFIWLPFLKTLNLYHFFVFKKIHQIVIFFCLIIILCYVDSGSSYGIDHYPFSEIKVTTYRIFYI
jgi:hypothetical protein